MMKPLSTTSPNLFDQLRLKLRANNYSYYTEQACAPYVEHFLRSLRQPLWDFVKSPCHGKGRC